MDGKNKLKKMLPNIIFIGIFLIGFGIFIYPYMSNFINVFTKVNEIQKYQVNVSKLTLDDKNSEFNKAYEFNKNLLGNTLVKNQEYVKGSEYNNILSMNGMIGYLKIDKINIRLPIYHGTNDSVLQSSIGHLEGSSFPIGKESEHSVLVGHTGLPSAKILTDLSKLSLGDTFQIIILNKVINYEIDNILVVKPNETESLQIEEGKTYCTLVTCTPYGVNSHRLLVRGVLKENKLPRKVISEAKIVDSNIVIISISLPIIIIVFIIMIIVRKMKK